MIDLGFTQTPDPVWYPWVRRYIYLQLILNSFTQLNDITVSFSPAQFVYIIALKQKRNIPDRCENLYAADRAI